QEQPDYKQAAGHDEDRDRPAADGEDDFRDPGQPHAEVAEDLLELRQDEEDEEREQAESEDEHHDRVEERIDHDGAGGGDLAGVGGEGGQYLGQPAAADAGGDQVGVVRGQLAPAAVDGLGQRAAGSQVTGDGLGDAPEPAAAHL